MKAEAATLGDARARGVAARAAWLAFAGQLLFVAAWLVAGALQQGYSHSEQYVTELGAATANHSWIVNGALVALGLTLVALAIGVQAALPRAARSLGVVVLLSLGGLATALTGVFALDCMPTVERACGQRIENGHTPWQTYTHFWASVAMHPTLLPIPFVLAWATWGGRAGRPALVAGVLGLLAGGFAFLAAAVGDAELAGLYDRLGYIAMHVGIAVLALALLVWSGSPRLHRLPAAEPGDEFEPFRFLRSRQSGSGATSYRLWARPLGLPQRFLYERRVDYEGEAVWRLQDAFRYEDGTTFGRALRARPLSRERMLTWGDDMPGGGETVLRSGGLDLEPCWILVPWWGLHWPTRWSGAYDLEVSGAMRAHFTFRLFGLLPMGHLDMHVVEQSPRETPAPASAV